MTEQWKKQTTAAYNIISESLKVEWNRLDTNEYGPYPSIHIKLKKQAILIYDASSQGNDFPWDVVTGSGQLGVLLKGW